MSDKNGNAKHKEIDGAADELLFALLSLIDWVNDHAQKPNEIAELQAAIAAARKAGAA